MKRNFKMFGLMLVVAALFVGCKWCPVGSPGDYKKLKEDGDTTNYEMTSGSGFYGKGYLPTTQYASGFGGSYYFTAKEDVTISYSEKLYHSEESLIRKYPAGGGACTYLKEESDKGLKNQTFEVKAGERIEIVFFDIYYSSKKTTAYEFYLWAE